MLLETRYRRLTFNLFTTPKTGSQTVRHSYLSKIYFHNQSFTLEIDVIFANIENGLIFYIIIWGRDLFPLQSLQSDCEAYPASCSLDVRVFWPGCEGTSV
jgi:hypothetical protein